MSRNVEQDDDKGIACKLYNVYLIGKVDKFEALIIALFVVCYVASVSNVSLRYIVIRATICSQ